MNYFAQYEKKLKLACKLRGFKLVELGHVGIMSEYPIYVAKNCLTPSSKKTICFLAGIHGEEYAGPLAVLKFLENTDFTQFPINLIFIPVANPSGFDLHKRYNYLGQQLNDVPKGKKLAKEVSLIYQYLKKHKISFFHALHEDWNKKRFYMYLFEDKEEKIYRDILFLAKKYFKINIHSNIAGDKAKKGLIINAHDDSFEDRLFCDGTKYAMCTETPGKMPLKKRIDLNVDIMKKVLDFIQNE